MKADPTYATGYVAAERVEAEAIESAERLSLYAGLIAGALGAALVLSRSTTNPD